ncbi:MAG: glycosyl hydrolase family 18 protein [Oscillospiraceae bacterium]|nr:glycosyl hydrolase family 18 protein [Oscillospiraceae bacterium]
MKNWKHSRGVFFGLGAAAGIVVTLAVVGCILLGVFAVGGSSSSGSAVSGAASSAASSAALSSVPDENGSSAAASSDTWNAETVYTGGETVSYNGKLYKARWWTQGEQPGSTQDGAWEDLLTADPNAAGTPQPDGVANVPIDASSPKNSDTDTFKVVGYYPSWKPDGLGKVDFNVLTHLNYAFAIPTADGGLLPLENGDTAKQLIEAAHKNGVRVSIAVGGWSYNDIPLEPTFISATDTPEKRKKFVDAIIALCDEYGFDGVDMDWEHPRVDGTSASQYEALMLELSQRLHAEGRLLTSAVISGATPDGNIYYDAAAHTNAVLNAVDWINVMAYDGGDGERHSGYDFAVACGVYWHETRGLPSEKVVLGVPFYARPSWAAYDDILAAVPTAGQSDIADYNGMQVYYNGVDTIQKKTRYAKGNLGGIMIWEVTQDTADRSQSLLAAIGEAAK